MEEKRGKMGVYIAHARKIGRQLRKQKQMKGNKRELIQLGVPIFGHIKEDAKSRNPTISSFSLITIIAGLKFATKVLYLCLQVIVWCLILIFFLKIHLQAI